jgi:cephalosporin-C deacetylase-like acetyl esterase
MNRERKPGAGGPVPWTGKLSARARSERYLDALHFAPDVGCPLFLNAGLCDTVSPPSTVYAVHQLARESVFVPLPNAGHDVTVAGDRAAWRWLEAELPPAE